MGSLDSQLRSLFYGTKAHHLSEALALLDNLLGGLDFHTQPKFQGRSYVARIYKGRDIKSSTVMT